MDVRKYLVQPGVIVVGIDVVLSDPDRDVGDPDAVTRRQDVEQRDAKSSRHSKS